MDEELKKIVWDLYKKTQSSDITYEQFESKMRQKGNNTFNLQCTILCEMAKKSRNIGNNTNKS